MQQLHSILQARASSAQGNPTMGQQGATAEPEEKFALHLNQLTEQLDGHKPQSKSKTTFEEAGAGDKTAVSELARTMLESADDDSLSADDAWLSMVEELNSMATGDVSLEELSTRHGIDVAQLEEQLNQALAEFGGDMQALIAQLQQVSGGKGLPPAIADSTQTDSKIMQMGRDSLKDALAESGNGADGKGESIEALLKRIEGLSPDQQSQFAASVEALMAQLEGSELSVDSAGQSIDLNHQAAQDLTDLTAQLKKQISELLESEVELSQQQRDQLDLYGSMVDQLDQLSLQTALSEPKSAQQVAEQLTQAEGADPSGEVGEILAALEELLNTSSDAKGSLQTVDVKALQNELNKLLDSLDNQPAGATRSELMALLQSQLEALEGLNQGEAQLQNSKQDSDILAQVNQLLSELNQKLDQVAADIRVVDAGRQTELSNGLPPVAHALGQVSQQLRAQIQDALQLQQQQGGETDEAEAGDFEGLRRLLSENMTSPNESRNNTTTTNQSTAGLQPMQQNTGQPAVGQNSNAPRAAETPAQSAFETARQAQQAIDILGTGASERLRERVSVMFNTRTQAAEMRLDPPDLGRLSIRLNMSQEQATVSFQVTTPQAREALEQSLPRLRELLAEQGIELADANVSEQQQNGSREASSGQGEYPSGGRTDFAEGDLLADGELEIESAVASAADGRVDYFV